MSDYDPTLGLTKHTTHELATVELPPIINGRATPLVEEKVKSFYLSVAGIFEAWVHRRESEHTQRAYRQDVMDLVSFLGMKWPEEATNMFRVTVADMQAWKDDMLTDEKAPKTINRRVSSTSSFFRFLQGVASEMRLPITVPNPAHAQFIARMSSDPVNETKALSATRARQLMGLPVGEDIIAHRDRAILKFFLYSGARIGTGCRLCVADFHRDEDDTKVRLREKGNRMRTIGLHFAAAEAISEYLDMAGISVGPIFRPRSGPRGCNFVSRHLTTTAMYEIVMGYLEQLPGAMQPVEVAENAEPKWRCIYSPHSLRATTATLLLDAGVDITKVQDLLGHRNITTTQIYDKRRRSTVESASHDVPI